MKQRLFRLRALLALFAAALPLLLAPVLHDAEHRSGAAATNGWSAGSDSGGQSAEGCPVCLSGAGQRMFLRPLGDLSAGRDLEALRESWSPPLIVSQRIVWNESAPRAPPRSV